MSMYQCRSIESVMKKKAELEALKSDDMSDLLKHHVDRVISVLNWYVGNDVIHPYTDRVTYTMYIRRWDNKDDSLKSVDEVVYALENCRYVVRHKERSASFNNQAGITTSLYELYDIELARDICDMTAWLIRIGHPFFRTDSVIGKLMRGEKV